ncbi:MAG TPA: hypothetical protein VGO62_20330, partial [Myxococcota bacterium]
MRERLELDRRHGAIGAQSRALISSLARGQDERELRTGRQRFATDDDGDGRQRAGAQVGLLAQ